MKYKFSVKENKENCAKALGRDLPISLKHAIEIANYIRKNSVEIARKKLQDAISLKKAIPFKRFTNGLGHKPGMASGRYVIKASSEILKLLESAVANAENKGLNAKSLVISHISAQQAGRVWHYGRHHRRLMKRCHVEIIVEEISKKEIEDKKENKKEEKQEKKI